MRYRKKPVVIAAIQWAGDNYDTILNFADSQVFIGSDGLFVRTLEGNMKASVGDYIIKGVKGEFYACKPDVFELTYEKVED